MTLSQEKKTYLFLIHIYNIESTLPTIPVKPLILNNVFIELVHLICTENMNAFLC